MSSHDAATDVQGDLRADPLLREAPLLEGYKVLPPVVLTKKLGAGAMGAVYRGRHLRLDIDVAVKCLRSDLVLHNAEYAARFEREARIAASCSQENLVRVYDTLQDYGLYYTLMEFVDGRDLEDRVRRRGPLPLREALTIYVAGMRALCELHGRHILHRDVKPPNILVSKAGVVKLADFGIAKQRGTPDADTSLVTAPNVIMGTPKYMPLEQFDPDLEVESPADVYAMAATLAFMLVGQHVVPGKDKNEIWGYLMKNGFPDLATLAPGTPPDVVELVRNCTLKDPDARHSTREALQLGSKLLHEAGGEVMLEEEGGEENLLTEVDPIDRARTERIRQHLTQPGGRSVGGGSDLPATEVSHANGQDLAATVVTPRRPSGGTTAPPPVKKGGAGKLIALAIVLLLCLGVGGAAAAYFTRPQWFNSLLGNTQLVKTDDPEEGGTTDVNTKPAGTNSLLPENISNATDPRDDVEPADDDRTPPPAVLPRLSVGATAATFDEDAGRATYVLRLDPASEQPVRVNVSTVARAADGGRKAVGGKDYVVIDNDTVTFAPREIEKMFTVDLLDDDEYDQNRAFALVLSSPIGAELVDDAFEAVATIVDDDPAPVVVTFDDMATEARRLATMGRFDETAEQLVKMLDRRREFADFFEFRPLAEELLTDLRKRYPSREDRLQRFGDLSGPLATLASTGGVKAAALLWVESTLEYDSRDNQLIGVNDGQRDAEFEQARTFALKAVDSEGGHEQPAAYRYLGDIMLFKDRDAGAMEQYARGYRAGDAESTARLGRFILSGKPAMEDVKTGLKYLHESAEAMTPPSGFGAYWYAATLESLSRQGPEVAVAEAERLFPDAADEPAGKAFGGQSVADYCRDFYIRSARLGYDAAQTLCRQRGYGF